MFFSQNKASPTGYFWTTIFQISNLNRIFFHHCWAKSEKSKIAQIYLSWTINDPIFSEIGDIKKIFQNFIEKKNLRNFLTKLKFDFFFIFFSKDVLITLLRGPKTMRKIYRVVFEKLRNPWKNFRKKSGWWFWRNILKKRIFRFFSANIPKDVQIHIF